MQPQEKLRFVSTDGINIKLKYIRSYLFTHCSIFHEEILSLFVIRNSLLIAVCRQVPVHKVYSFAAAKELNWLKCQSSYTLQTCWCIDLVNISSYEQSEWGWSDKQKLEEMTDEKAWYLLARDSATGEPVAVVHFRFDLDFDEEVLYW